MGKDVVGAALLDYYANNYSEDIIVKSSVAADDVLPIPYLFRTAKELPKLEQLALKNCCGKVLDVGAGSGCHSIILQEKGIDVVAIDTSKGAVELMNKRGLKAECINFFETKGQYDTLLFLMNGLGLAGTLKVLPQFLKKAMELLLPNGQILLDSSDIKYLYAAENGTQWVDLNSAYYGEVSYQMAYKNKLTDPFDWLFVDFEQLKKTAATVGLKATMLYEDKHQQYLAQLSKV